MPGNLLPMASANRAHRSGRAVGRPVVVRPLLVGTGLNLIEPGDAPLAGRGLDRRRSVCVPFPVAAYGARRAVRVRECAEASYRPAFARKSAYSSAASRSA